MDKVNKIWSIFKKYGVKIQTSKRTLQDQLIDILNKYLGENVKFKNETLLRDVEPIKIIGAGESGIGMLMKKIKQKKEELVVKFIFEKKIGVERDNISIDKEIEYGFLMSKIEIGPKIYHYERYDKLTIIYMEKFESSGLDKLIELSRNKSKDEEIKKFSEDIIDLLKTLKKNCLIHGDFHLMNMMYDKDNRLKLIDFGRTFKYSKNKKIFSNNMYYDTMWLIRFLYNYEDHVSDEIVQKKQINDKVAQKLITLLKDNYSQTSTLYNKRIIDMIKFIVNFAKVGVPRRGNDNQKQKITDIFDFVQYRDKDNNIDYGYIFFQEYYLPIIVELRE